MKSDTILMASIFLVLVLGVFIVHNVQVNESEDRYEGLTSEEKIELAVSSAELASYGWDSNQDQNSGLLALGGYINSVRNADGDGVE